MSSDLNLDFNPSEEPVWILGVKYSSLYGLRLIINYYINYK